MYTRGLQTRLHQREICQDICRENARRLKFGMFLDGYLFFGAILKFSGRKKRKTTSSQEGTNQSMAVLPIQLVSFLLLSFLFSRYSQTTLYLVMAPGKSTGIFVGIFDFFANTE